MFARGVDLWCLLVVSAVSAVDAPLRPAARMDLGRGQLLDLKERVHQFFVFFRIQRLDHIFKHGFGFLKAIDDAPKYVFWIHRMVAPIFACGVSRTGADAKSTTGGDYKCARNRPSAGYQMTPAEKGLYRRIGGTR